MVYEELRRLEKISEHITRKVKMLERENESLKNELKACQIELKEKDEALEHFKNQIKISKIVKNMPVESKASAELRERIDSYIREIDKIITHLSE
jgi:signal recognition particle GTPase